MKRVLLLGTVLVAGGLLFGVTAVSAKGGRAGSLGEVYVSSQGLYYDTFVSASSLPMHGPFQKLEDGVTEFGPGDPGYLGGRWWVDNNHNNIQDEGDSFLLCPLLGPGRTESNNP
jgi:hypothetical protein